MQAVRGRRSFLKFAVNHDFHCHTFLSSCSADPEMTPERILRHAEEAGYEAVCLTNHLWDADVPGVNAYYAPQDIAHVKKALPLPHSDKVRLVFGCETEFLGGDKLALTPKHFEEFGFILTPVNHFNMLDFTRPASVNTVDGVAELFTARLEELCKLDLPWEKVGIPHLTCILTFKDGDYLSVFQRMDEQRLRPVFRFFAQKGAGIELNAGTLRAEGWERHKEAVLRLYQIARDEGCKFYCGSDAHHPAELDAAGLLRQVADALELTDAQRYRLPNSSF